MKSMPFLLTLLLVSVGSVSTVFGQSKFSVSTSFAPFYNYVRSEQRLILSDENGNLVPYELSARSTGRTITPGLMIHYAFSPRWSVSTGIWASYNYAARTRVRTSPPLEEFIVGSSRFRHFESPLFINFRTSAKRLSPYFSIGALFEYPAAVQVEGFGRVRFGRRVEVAPMLSAGVDYRLTDRFRLTAQPTLIWRLPDSDVESLISYRVGMLVQAVYGF